MNTMQFLITRLGNKIFKNQLQQKEKKTYMFYSKRLTCVRHT